MGSSRRPRTTRPRHGRTAACTRAGSQVAVRLADVAFQLESIYSVGITVQLALNHQNAEQDRELERTLRLYVSEPVSRMAETLRAIIGRLDGEQLKRER